MADGIHIRVEAILREMRGMANPHAREEMARFGLQVENAFGLRVPAIRAIARRIGRDQALAEALWGTKIYDARILASLIADPLRITRRTADEWVADFDSWSVCDACSCNLFDRTPYAWSKIRKWAKDDREYVRRAAFATIAAAASHDKAAADPVFLDALVLTERYAFDERNFVRKAVNWALRGIGKRNAQLRLEAIACAERIAAQGTKSARWIASDALRELRSAGGIRNPAAQGRGRRNHG